MPTLGPAAYAEREFDQLALRFAAITRVVVLAGCGAIGLSVATGALLPRDMVAVAVLIAWSLASARTSRQAPPWWVTCADLALVSAVGVCQGALITPAAVSGGANWVLAMVSFSACVYQWQLRLVPGLAAMLGVAGAYLIGAELSFPGLTGEWLPLAAWMVAEAVLARGVYQMLRASGARADEYLAGAQRARLAAEVARARELDEREHLARLHDTAAATLLMIGAGVVGTAQEWLAGQAQRDLTALRGAPPAASGNIDLAGAIAAALAEAGWRGGPLFRFGPVPVPIRVAEAFSGAVGEALRNVARHARTGRAALRLYSAESVVVEVRDDGAGFEPGRLPLAGRGIAESIVARMERAGGSAAVTSVPGEGTVVRLEWAAGPHLAAEPNRGSRPADQPSHRIWLAPSAPVPDIIAAGFFRRLRIGVLLVLVTTLLGWHLPALLALAGRGRSLWPVAVPIAALAAIAAVMGWLLVRERSFGWLRWPLAIAVLAAAIMVHLGTSAQDMISGPHRSWEIFGWFAVLLFLDRSPGLLIAAFGVQFAVNATDIALEGHYRSLPVAAMGLQALIVGGWQVVAVMIHVALRRAAAAASSCASQAQRLAAAEATAERLRQDRAARYAELADTTVPLLTGLSTGELSPADPAVRRACAVEAARLRRLIAERDDTAEPLQYELRACVMVAERRGVAVQVAIRGDPAPVPVAIRRALTDPALELLAQVSETARVTLDTAGQRIVLSAVGEVAGPWAPPAPVAGPVTVSWLASGRVVWMEAVWDPARLPALAGRQLDAEG